MAGYGYTRFFPVEKLLRDARLYRIYEGTSEIQRIILAGHALNTYRTVMPSLEDLPIDAECDSTDSETTQDGADVRRCRVCGYVHRGENPPPEYPYCFFRKASSRNIAAKDGPSWREASKKRSNRPERRGCPGESSRIWATTRWPGAMYP